MFDPMVREAELAYRRERISADYAASRRRSGGARWSWRSSARRHGVATPQAGAPQISLS